MGVPEILLIISRRKKWLFPVCLNLLLFISFPALSQKVIPYSDTLQSDTLVKHLVKIDKIFIRGNKKTRDYIILRELSLKEGELVAYEDLEEILKKDRQRVSNTRLFLKVEIVALPLSERLYDIIVEVSERWYVIPSPIFQLADRNFNDWWVNQDRDLSRVNLGFKFTHYNFRGRSEKLSLQAKFGYARTFFASYYIPYIDKTRKNGLGFSFSYAENTNIPLRTTGHRRLFIDNDSLNIKDPIREAYGAGITFSRRASFYNTHSIALSYNALFLKDTIIALNPDYLLTQSNSMRYFNLSYNFRRDFRDIVGYPLKGFLVNGGINKKGLGIYNDINIFSLSGSYSQYLPFKKKFFFSNAISTRISVPQYQPYQHLTGLGYGGDYVRGFELYVIEGQHQFLNKTEIKYQLFKEEVSLGRFMPLDQFRTIPFALYPKIYFDAGYVVMPVSYPTNQLLTNKPIWGAGVGLDVVSFYDFVFRLEYSFNSLKESGFFFNFNAGI